MAWKATCLAPLKRKPQVHNFISLDTEDDQLGYGEGRGFYLGAVWSPLGGRSFTSRESLLRYLCNERWSGWWCACHNLEYDALSVFGVAGIIDMEPCFSGSKLCSLSLRYGSGRNDRLTFFDTSCFLQDSLRNLAKLVNMEKLEIEMPAGDRRVTRKRVEYNLRDAEITWKLAHYIQDGIVALGAQMRLTAASTALDCFRRRYLHEEVPLVDADVQTQLHGGYYGGRVECFRLGEYDGPIYQNDINGAYVSVMIDQEFPELGAFGRKSGSRCDLSLQGMAEVDLKVPGHLWAPPMPVKGEKLIFPVGRLRGRWTYNELRQAINYGVKIVKVHQCWESPRSKPYLREMMLSLRAIREDPATPAAVSRLAKLIGNSTYGKFAQKGAHSRYMAMAQYEKMVASGELVEGENYVAERTHIYPHAQVARVVSRVDDYPVHSNVIWAALITAGCRGLLYPHLEKGNSMYCDTDSVMGYRDYPATKELGKLAHQHSYSRVVIRGNKLYAGLEAGKWVAHAKGIPRNQAERAVLYPEEPVKCHRPAKLRTAMGGKLAANEWYDLIKHQRGEYDKRTVLPNGDTVPLELNQW